MDGPLANPADLGKAVGLKKPGESYKFLYTGPRQFVKGFKKSLSDPKRFADKVKGIPKTATNGQAGFSGMHTIDGRHVGVFDARRPSIKRRTTDASLNEVTGTNFGNGPQVSRSYQKTHAYNNQTVGQPAFQVIQAVTSEKPGKRATFLREVVDASKPRSSANIKLTHEQLAIFEDKPDRNIFAKLGDPYSADL